ncbi:hypothetical protein GGQ84_000385 [Desulfitispora alkaliphila]|uniref:radical SAM/SPASM domain-containing protein n=1 Tax=Desulfitispora alkaliphila TaxID=622674 RepID=UPI003D191A5E
MGFLNLLTKKIKKRGKSKLWIISLELESNQYANLAIIKKLEPYYAQIEQIQLHVREELLEASLIEEAAKRIKAKEIEVELLLSYALTKESIIQLPKAIIKAHEIGIKKIELNHPNCRVADTANLTSIVNSKGQLEQEYVAVLEEAKKLASDKEISMQNNRIEFEEEKAVCEVDPTTIFFLTATGNVAPCMCLGGNSGLRKKVFGNIFEEDLDAIWNKQNYVDFREQFRQRIQKYKEFMIKYMEFEPSLTVINKEKQEYREIFKKNTAPKECSGCVKLYEKLDI